MTKLPPPAPRPISRFVALGLGAAVVGLTSIVTISTQSAKAGIGNRVPLCHRTHSTTNPYRRITVSKNSHHDDNHIGAIFGLATPWGDIIPSGYQPMKQLNFTGNTVGQAIYNGTTGCKRMTPLEFITSEIAAGQTLATVLADLDDQGAVEDAATLASLGSATFATAFAGQTLSQIQTALVAATPVATTSSATVVTSTAATLNGTGSANSANVTVSVSFIYGTDLTLATFSTVAATPSSAAGTTTVSAAASVTGLTASTTYAYRIVLTYTDTASGATAEYPGAIMTFTTPATGATTTTAAPTTTAATTTSTTTPSTSTTTTVPTTSTSTTTTEAPTTSTTPETTTAPSTTEVPATTTTTEAPAATTSTVAVTTSTLVATASTSTTSPSETTTSTTLASVSPTTAPPESTSTTSPTPSTENSVAPTKAPQGEPSTTDPRPDSAAGPATTDGPTPTTRAASSTSASTSTSTTGPAIPVGASLRGRSPGTSVVVRSPNGSTIAELTADENGDVSLDVLAAGRYVIESTNATGQPEVVVVEVLGVQTQNSSSLALTGSDAGPTMVLAIFCIAVGLLLTVRRRSPR